MTTRIFCPGWYVTTIDGTEHYSRSMTAGVLWGLETRQKILDRQPPRDAGRPIRDEPSAQA